MGKLQSYFKRASMCTLCTIDTAAKPYASTVYFVYDDEDNLYFLSKKHREHSKHILENSFVAVAIVDQTQKPIDKKQGLQIQGVCEPLLGQDALCAFELFVKRFPFFEDIVEKDEIQFSVGEDIFKKETMWKIVPQEVKIWDEELYGGDGKVIEK